MSTIGAQGSGQGISLNLVTMIALVHTLQSFHRNKTTTDERWKTRSLSFIVYCQWLSKVRSLPGNEISSSKQFLFTGNTLRTSTNRDHTYDTNVQVHQRAYAHKMLWLFFLDDVIYTVTTLRIWLKLAFLTNFFLVVFSTFAFQYSSNQTWVLS